MDKSEKYYYILLIFLVSLGWILHVTWISKKFEGINIDRYQKMQAACNWVENGNTLTCTSRENLE